MESGRFPVRAAVLAAAAALAAAWTAPPARADGMERALALAAGARYAEARAALDPLLGAAGGPPPRARLLHGVLRAREGRLDDAAQILEALRRDRPDMPETYNNLAVLHAARGRPGEALALLRGALERWPDFAAAHENLGEVHAQLARRAWARARELEPDREASGFENLLASLIAPAAPAAPDAPAAEDAAAAAAAPMEPPAPPIQPMPPLCAAAWFEDAAAAARAAAWLRARGAAAESRAESRGAAQSRVYIPPFADRAAAAAALRELRGRGLRDVGVIGDGPLANGVSLGVFRSADRARRRAAELRGMGYAPQIETRAAPAAGYAVEARFAAPPGAPQAEWAAAWPARPLAPAPCR